MEVESRDGVNYITREELNSSPFKKGAEFTIRIKTSAPHELFDGVLQTEPTFVAYLNAFMLNIIHGNYKGHVEIIDHTTKITTAISCEIPSNQVAIINEDGDNDKKNKNKKKGDKV